MARAGWLAAFAAVGLLAAGCAQSSSALEQTESNMAKLKSGHMDLELSSKAGVEDQQTGPVGFRLEGPFSFVDDTKYAVFDLTYDQLLGDDTRSTMVKSTGSAVFVTTGGTTYRVPENRLGSLENAEDAGRGINDLGIAGWVEDPKTRKQSGNEIITGKVDVSDLLSDIARIAGSLGDDTQLNALSDDEAARLEKLVQASSIEVITDAETRELQSLHAEIEFGTRAPNELRRTLGKYAAAHLEIDLAMSKLDGQLRVEAPAGAVEP